MAKEIKKKNWNILADATTGLASVIPGFSGIQQGQQDQKIVDTHNSLQETKRELIELAKELGVDASALEVKKDRNRNIISAARSFATNFIPGLGGLQEVSQWHQNVDLTNEIAEMERIAKEINIKNDGGLDLSYLDEKPQSKPLLNDVATFITSQTGFSILNAGQQVKQEHQIFDNMNASAELAEVTAQLRRSQASAPVEIEAEQLNPNASPNATFDPNKNKEVG